MTDNKDIAATRQDTDDSLERKAQELLFAWKELDTPSSKEKDRLASFSKEIEHEWADIVECVRKMADSGNVDAQTLLASIYKDGVGVPQDASAAAALYQKAAEQGNAVAALFLASLYLGESNHERDIKQYWIWLQKAAELGLPQAQVAVGNIFLDGLIDECDRLIQNRDFNKAAEWYEKAARKESPEGQEKLAQMLEDGYGFMKDKDTAFRWYKAAAEQGRASAQMKVAQMYADGIDNVDIRVEMKLSKTTHEAEAFKWFFKAAEQGLLAAKVEVASRLEEGRGTKTDKEAATKWYISAAEQGSIVATRKTAEAYELGIGIGQDSGKAAEFYRQAAELGDAIAMNDLGRCYWHGAGGRLDKECAISWWRRAANLDNDDARFALATCQLDGDGMEKDYPVAMSRIADLASSKHVGALAKLGEIRSRAEAGHPQYQYLLALSLLGKDDAKAEEWIQKAADQGHVEAQAYLFTHIWTHTKGPEDRAAALKVLEEAAETGNVYAQCKLGEYYCEYYFDDAEEGKELGFKWFERAAAQGDARGLSGLGDCYWCGTGVEKDLKRAFELHSMAAKQGFVEAQLWLAYHYADGEGVDKNQDEGLGLARFALTKDNSLYSVGNCVLLGSPSNGKDLFEYTLRYNWPMTQRSIWWYHNIADAIINDNDENMIRDARPFEKAGNVVFWAKYINDQHYRNATGLTSLAYTQDFYPLENPFPNEMFDLFFTFAEIDEICRLFFWLQGSEKPLREMLDVLDGPLWMYRTEGRVDCAADHAIKAGQLSGMVCQWVYTNPVELPESYPLFKAEVWDRWATDAESGINRLRVVFNAILRSSLVKLFGCYEKHVAAIVPLLENKFAIYEDYKAYVDALPSDKDNEFYQQLREKLGFATEEGYRRSFAW